MLIKYSAIVFQPQWLLMVFAICYIVHGDGAGCAAGLYRSVLPCNKRNFPLSLSDQSHFREIKGNVSFSPWKEIIRNKIKKHLWTHCRIIALLQALLSRTFYITFNAEPTSSPTMSPSFSSICPWIPPLFPCCRTEQRLRGHLANDHGGYLLVHRDAVLYSLSPLCSESPECHFARLNRDSSGWEMCFLFLRW